VSTRVDRSTVGNIRTSPGNSGQAVPNARVRAVFPDGVAGGGGRVGHAALVIGRDPGPGGLTIEHETVSRRHLALVWDGRLGRHVVSDLGSYNGSRVDGVALAGAPSHQPRALVNGSVLRLGDALLVYESGADVDAEETAAGAAAMVCRSAVPGEAAAMSRFRQQLGRAAVDRAAVLVIGETGTGKERIAGEVHRLSGRPGPLVAVNCAALSPHLVESQLFGHTRGAFTGASAAQGGLFRAAEGGTLFLDEVGELPLELQPKLLRAIEQGEVQPVGSAQTLRVDVRIVSATNRDLAEASASGTFRPDLYARLSTWELRLPALRERRVDFFTWLEILRRRFADGRFSASGGAPVPPAFSPAAAELLLGLAWPLNLRGLERLVHELDRAGTGAGAEPIDPQDLPSWLTDVPRVLPDAGAVGPPATAAGAIRPIAAPRLPLPTREEFTTAVEQLSGNVRQLAKHFRRDRRQIYRWLESYGLKGRFRPE
jgi:DNA-binding NtrC family response regulator